MAAPQNSGYLQSNDPTKPRSDAAVPFRDIIPSPDHPRIAGIEKHTALSWCESRRQIEAPAWLINRLDAKNLETPYKGFTSDGKVKEGLYNYAEDEGAPTKDVVEKSEALLGILSEKEKEAVQCGEVTDDRIRLWSNPELYMNPGTSIFCDSGKTTDSCRWSPSGRMRTRNPNRDPFHPQSLLLPTRLRKGPRMLPHKRFSGLLSKWKESPQRTLV